MDREDGAVVDADAGAVGEEKEREIGEMEGKSDASSSKDTGNNDRDEGDGGRESGEAEQPEKDSKEAEEGVDIEEGRSSEDVSDEEEEEEEEEEKKADEGGGPQMEKGGAVQVKRYSSKEERLKRLRELHKRRVSVSLDYNVFVMYLYLD